MNTTLKRFFIEDVSAGKVSCRCGPTCCHQKIAFFKLRVTGFDDKPPNDSLIIQNTQLADAVEKGSALNLSTISVDAIKERNSGKLVSTSRARATDKFKVCFTIADNVIAEAGDREFYIEVLGPQGNVLGEGLTKTTEEGNSLTYSKGTNFYYENDALDVCDYINKPSGDFQDGNYMVNVYDNKLKLLGTSSFELK